MEVSPLLGSKATGSVGRLPSVRLEALPGVPPERVEQFSRLRGMAMVMAGLMTFSGSFKEIPVFAAVPIDLTLLTTLGAFTLALAYSILVRSFPAGRSLAVLFFFTVMASVGSIMTVSTDYGVQKFSRLFIVTIAAGLPIWLMVRTHRDAHRLIRILMGMAFFLSIFINFWGERQYGFGRLTTEEGTTISFGRAAGFVIIVIAGWFISSDRVSLVRAVTAIGIAGFAVWTMLAIASKGPILGLAIGMLAMAVVQLRRLRIKSGVRLVALFLALASAILVAWLQIPKLSRDRIIDADDGSTGSRATAWDFTWENVTGSPIGNGWGHWDTVAPIDIVYPHNIFLEVWWEAGLIGLIALCIALWIPIRNMDRTFTMNRFHATTGTGILLYWLAGGLVSGEINDNKILFILMVALAAPFVGNDPDEYGMIEVENSNRPDLPERAPTRAEPGEFIDLDEPESIFA